MNERYARGLIVSLSQPVARRGIEANVSPQVISSKLPLELNIFSGFDFVAGWGLLVYVVVHQSDD